MTWYHSTKAREIVEELAPLTYQRAPKAWREKLGAGYESVLVGNSWDDHKPTATRAGISLAEWELGERAGIWDDRDPYRWEDFKYELEQR